MINSLKYSLLIVLLTLSITGQSQDPHYSNLRTNSFLNFPSQTGLFKGCYRVNTNYRSQWITVGSPYSTFTLSVDEPIKFRNNPKRFMGAGIYVLQENSLSNAFKFNDIKLSVSFHEYLDYDKHHKVSAGFQIGAIQGSINVNDLGFGNQFDFVSDFDLTRNNFESFNAINTGGLDYNAGFHYTLKQSFIELEVGLATHHILEPNFSIMGAQGAVLSRRISGFIFNKLTLAKKINITPQLMVSRQNRNLQIMIGGNIATEGLLISGEGKSIALGSYFRVGDAWILTSDFIFKTHRFTFSYDSNLSGLLKATNSVGAFELGYTLTINCKPEMPSDFTLPCIRL